MENSMLHQIVQIDYQEAKYLNLKYLDFNIFQDFSSLGKRPLINIEFITWISKTKKIELI